MKISGLIITLNEEMHITECIQSMMQVCDDIVVVDSLSIDKTCDIANKLGKKTVSFLDHWVNYPDRYIRNNLFLFLF